MSLFHDPYHFLQQSRGTQTTFFPVPKRKRKKKSEDNDFFDNIDPFTGVPDGFYRAFAIRSPLEQLPVIVQNRIGEGEARLEREYNSVETQTEEREHNSVETQTEPEEFETSTKKESETSTPVRGRPVRQPVRGRPVRQRNTPQRTTTTPNGTMQFGGEGEPGHSL